MAQHKNYSMARQPRKKQKFDNLTKGMLVVFAVVGLLLAYFGGKYVFTLVKSWSLTSLSGVPVASANTDTISAATVNLQAGNTTKAKAWDGKSRVNILLLGLDYSTDRGGRDLGQKLTDTMILISVDPLSQTIGAMSIRRDLWVNIPEGFGYDRINTAYSKGEANNLPGGGPGLAVETVEQFLGVSINYYAQINLDSFVKLIDEIDGVTVKITTRMLADWKGTGEMFWIEPGIYTLPGSYALAYARCREECGDDLGDVGRGARQMEMINAIRSRILDFNMLPKLIARAPAIYQEVSDGIQTNMTLNQAIQLGSLMMQIPNGNMQTYNMDYSQMEGQTIICNGVPCAVLMPYPDQIRLLRDKMFANQGSAAAPIVTGNSDPLALAIQENARIQLLNGTDSSGLADTTAAYLKSKGLNVVGTDNGESTTYTTITISGATPYTVSYLASLMNVQNTQIISHPDANATADITINLGSDWANKNPIGQ